MAASLSIKEMPEVDALSKCSLPIVFTSRDAVDFPGIKGTCFAVRVNGRDLFVTARHVVPPEQISENTIDVVTGFGKQRATARIAQVLYPEPAHPDFEAALDLALMLPAGTPTYVA